MARENKQLFRCDFGLGLDRFAVELGLRQRRKKFDSGIDYDQKFV